MRATSKPRIVVSSRSLPAGPTGNRRRVKAARLRAVSVPEHRRVTTNRVGTPASARRATPLVRMRYLTPNDPWLATVRPSVWNQLPPPRPRCWRSAGRLPTSRWTSERRAHRSPCFAQQARSNSALRNRTNHHALAFLLCCNALLREGLWWALWWGSLDGMQGVRGSNPLSSTRHSASAALPRRAVCQ
jgi:hypothetical protein